MVISGIAMVIYDSRIVHRALKRIKNLLRRRHPETQVELGDIASPAEGPLRQEQPSEDSQIPESVQIDQNPKASPASGVNSPPSAHVDQTKVVLDVPPRTTGAAVNAEDVKLPYSIRVGLLLLCFFLVSFVVVMVVRGVVHGLPSDFRFFANIYLAGTSLFYDRLILVKEL